MEQSPEHSDYKPKFYNLLTDPDKAAYTRLRSALSSHVCRNRRGKRLETFAEMLAAIQTFCIRGEQDDWKRCLVCGVCWLSSGIAVNTRQLSLLIDKCKSSINGSLQKLGYSTIQSKNDSSTALTDFIPVLKNNFSELREWSVRMFVAATPQPNLPVYNVNTSYSFNSPTPNLHSGYYQYPSNSCTFNSVQPAIQRPPPAVTPPIPLPQLDIKPQTSPPVYSSPDPIPDDQPDEFFNDPLMCVPDFLLDDQDDPTPANIPPDPFDDPFGF